MVACMMGNMQTVRILVEQAAKLYLPHSPEDFRTFIDIKIDRNLGGNNALLYACANNSPSAGSKSSTSIIDVEGNYMLVSYLIDEAGADPNITNDIL